MTSFPYSITLLLIGLLLVVAPSSRAQSNQFRVQSPDGAITVDVTVGPQIKWSVRKGDQAILEPSAIALHLADGTVLGKDAKVTANKTESVDTQFDAIHYVKAKVRDHYTQLHLEFAGDFGVIFRTYNDGVTYRFVTKRSGELVVKDEEANFNFTGDYPAFIPYLWDYRGGHPFNASFESPYSETKLSEWKADSYSILPMVVTTKSHRKVQILEADLEDYPGMFLVPNGTGRGLKGYFARYPLEVEAGGYQQINLIPTKRADYIAKTAGTRSFPWRTILISERDADFLGNDIVQRLAAPSRITDTSWIQVGQVAWDWWSGYNLKGVDFVAGMNTTTFRYFIDFASKNGAKYIILDEGWAQKYDLTKPNPDVNLQELIAYGKEKNVGIILWASWAAVVKQMHEMFPKYAAMGVKGWKIDFIDRDDQVAVKSTYEIAEFAAKHKMLVDYHGVFKPTGLQRTFPNVVGYEGVYGLENFKWADMDAPRYAVTIPFIRNVAGPMDYTSGAMRNVTQAGYVARNYAPMAKGTRVNQLAQYVVFDVPLQMLSDSPTTYEAEQESTDFITSIPTTFDETVALDGTIAEYVALARRKGDTWYIGAMTNWTKRDITLLTDFLPKGDYEAVIFSDGVNADREATDYKKTVRTISAGEQLKLQLAPGGGWAAVLKKK